MLFLSRDLLSILHILAGDNLLSGACPLPRQGSKFFLSCSASLIALSYVLQLFALLSPHWTVSLFRTQLCLFHLCYIRKVFCIKQEFSKNVLKTSSFSVTEFKEEMFSDIYIGTLNCFIYSFDIQTRINLLWTRPCAVQCGNRDEKGTAVS